jgi:hypothetical protein
LGSLKTTAPAALPWALSFQVTVSRMGRRCASTLRAVRSAPCDPRRLLPPRLVVVAAARRARPPSSVASAQWDCGHSAAAVAAAESPNRRGVASSTTAAALPAAVVLEATGVPSAAVERRVLAARVVRRPPRSIHRVCALLALGRCLARAVLRQAPFGTCQALFPRGVLAFGASHAPWH